MDDLPQTMREELYPLGFQCGEHFWQRLALGEALQAFDSAQIFYLRQLTARELRHSTSAPLSAAELQLWGVLNQSLYLLGRSWLRINPLSLSEEVQSSAAKIETTYLQKFPVVPTKATEIDQALAQRDRSCGDFFLLELCLLSLQSDNRALRDGRMLFSSELESLKTSHPFDELLQQLDRQAAADSAKFGDRSLLTLLKEPLLAAPDNLAQQLTFLHRNWSQILPPELLAKIESALALHQDDFRQRGPVGAPDPADLSFHTPSGEDANFTPDRDWMPGTVLLAKAIFVWLHQLSSNYGREIRHLDQIPDEELDRIRDFGFSGLWLIGIWQRSEASRQIKHLHGKRHVSASAYAIHDYRIADELGGETAFDNLNHRCLQRGIHLAADVVTNHTGIDSQWVRQHPDWFIQSEHPPYPGYRYTGTNLSGDPGLCIQIEDGYYDHSEAAVVFCRRDQQTGQARYIYHGNDGTHLPWNDTAQLNFMLPQVREAMIDIILKTAKRFGIIRFDAAMTLARKHFQRLWFPLPGGGEGVPSRSAWAMSNDEFKRLFPVEFWREVVERIKAEQPDTLLIAEAFWLMEGYFVRTLGMHRVYNSAFMNMLKREDNARYRKTLTEILVFDPAILQRFVNFMSNPDEETAIEQFGNSDKYFCVATLLCSMPGLPLFAHGQLEGLREKYGMEYNQPAWQEKIDTRLLNEHWQLIAPLLRRRQLFSGAENFQLYDFVSDRGIEEDVYVLSNSFDGQSVVVLCNNSPHRISGQVGSAVDSKSAQQNLSSALNLRQKQGFYCCASLNSPLDYLRPANQPFRFDLPPYAHLVLGDFHHQADQDGRWKKLSEQIKLVGTTNLSERAQLVELWPSLEQLSHWLDPGTSVPDAQDLNFTQAVQELLTTLEASQLSAERLLQLTAATLKGPRLDLSAVKTRHLAQIMCTNTPPSFGIEQLFDDPDLEDFLDFHEYQGKTYFQHEALGKLITLLALQNVNSHNFNRNNISNFSSFFKNLIINCHQTSHLAEKSTYLLDDFLQSLSLHNLSFQQELPRLETGGGVSAMKILFVTSEATPFAKTGGLADVAGSLPRALRQRGHDVRVIMPCYRSVQRNGFSLSKGRKTIEVEIGGEKVRANLRQTIWEGVPFHFIDAPEYFDREHLYGTPEGDYQDNARRFTFFCRAVLEYLVRADFRPDILHLHDWQTGLIPALLKTERAADPFFAATATVMTIHNLGYQGLFPLQKIEKLGLPKEFAKTEHLEYFGKLSLLKGGIVHADLLNTVSETYCREIQQTEQGHGFDGLLRSRSRDLYGILNGINEKSWDPALDPALNKPFNSANLNGKRSCKRALQKELGLKEQHDLPLIAVVSRLDKQKGIDLIEKIWPQLMQRKLQFVLLGSGDQEQTAFWQARQQENADNVAIGLTFDENLSRRIYAAADCLLVPSHYEPCGLTQMIALRYGALPIVRQTGGLADTIQDLQESPRNGNGFVFKDAEPEALLQAVDRALEFYPRRNRWLSVIKKGMESDFSWKGSAQRYEELYQTALANRRSHPTRR